jgi:hypothetical protein
MLGTVLLGPLMENQGEAGSLGNLQAYRPKPDSCKIKKERN